MSQPDTYHATLAWYQARTRDTAVYPQDTQMAALSYCTLGLTGEAGEIANKVKKIFRDKGGVVDNDDIVAFKKEAGDVLYYLASLAHHFHVDLSDIAVGNIEKLAARKAAGTLQGNGDDR